MDAPRSQHDLLNCWRHRSGSPRSEPESLAEPQRFAKPERFAEPERFAQPERFAKPEWFAFTEPRHIAEPEPWDLAQSESKPSTKLQPYRHRQHDDRRRRRFV